MVDISTRLHEVNAKIADVKKHMAAYKILDVSDKYKYVYVYTNCGGDMAVEDVLDKMKIPYVSTTTHIYILREHRCQHRKMPKNRGCTFCSFMSILIKKEIVEKYSQYSLSNNFLNIDVIPEIECVFENGIFTEPVLHHLCERQDPFFVKHQCGCGPCYELYKVEIPIYYFQEGVSNRIVVFPIMASDFI